jgi:hypothetical protein
MATLQQKKVAKKIVEALESDETPTAAQVLKSVGYGTGLQHNPQRVLESKGVREELSNLGFSIDAADSVVTEILHSGQKEESRLKAADMVYKRLAGYAPERSIALKADLKDLKGSEALLEVKEKYEEELRTKLLDEA